MFQADVLRWKCFAQHPFWEGSRGYALRSKGNVAAFGCVVPCRFKTESGSVAGCNVIDWAASKTVPGAGVMLYRHIQGLTGVMINIGGTEGARRVLPTIGFTARGELHHYTRVLRPWHHLRQSGRMDWKTPLRLARDVLAARSPVKVRRMDADPAATQPVVCARTPELLAYVLGCPAAMVEEHAFDGGVFLLSRVGKQCRIADLWMQSSRPHDWAAAYTAAAAAASTDPNTTEVTIGASHPLQIEALRQAGYRQAHAEPVFVRDPGHLLGDRSDLALSFLENDAFFWQGSAAHSG